MAKATKTIKVEQTGSADPPPSLAAGRRWSAWSSTRSAASPSLQDTPEVRGMIDKVRHLVRVVDGK